ncbi:hypothetical protein PHLGIDRAFT_20325 [Phlebiopsis gigantea 11061_1 CR5-6]|uniref:Uncharacterized protein n=1 Tax=Phlebiopsis gigantea (strain 11061_1 CR5-6) TaxID=745531 RepID=A0A0C3NEG7_PHLG1|nr:hypothetical protein PHLGIDRAFT_20325 [Phlebiopsis gigantea 11061_1 CR5-6]
MKSFAVVSLLATLAVASIPTGISSGCSSYLTKLDSDTSLQSCLNSLANATAAFGPGGSGSASPDSVKSAISTLSSGSSCSETTIRGTLTDFYGACQEELTSNLNAAAVQIYDVLYTIIPLVKAATSKDDSGNFCATEIAGTPPSASSLYSTEQTVVTPDFNTLQSSNAVFLFLTPSLFSDKLCTTCTRNIITSYISFESDISYAPGLPNSVLLKGQSALYQAVQSTCGATFLSGAVQAAGSLSDGLISGKTSGASRTVGASSGTIAALFGAAAVVAAAL